MSQQIGDDDPFDPAALSGNFDVSRLLVALVVDDPHLFLVLREVLVAGGFIAVPAPDVSTVCVAIVCGHEAVATTRARMRPNGAVIALVDGKNVAAAMRAGAYGCARLPVVPEEVQALVRSAFESQSTRTRVVDLEKRVELQDHLAQIGRVTAGLTHEIGNPLCIARLNVEMMRDSAEEAGAAAREARAAAAAGDVKRALEVLERAEESANEAVGIAQESLHSLDRLGTLVHAMRSLIGKSPPVLAPVDLAQVVERVVEWKHAENVADVRVEIAVDERLRAMAATTMLEQVLVNLFDNAVRAARESKEAPWVRFHVYRGDEGMVTLSVRDNGCGVAPSEQQRIFEAFYTTHRDSGGTGLGLALCREYVRRMGGRITLWSEPGRGACFRVHLRGA